MRKTPIKTMSEVSLRNLRRWWFEIKQPTPEQKSAGWFRKRKELEVLRKLFLIFDMSVSELKQRATSNKETIEDLIIYNYVLKSLTSTKILINLLNKFIPYQKC